MSVIEASPKLTQEDARSLTDEIKADAERLWAKLLGAYEGGAHKALGYSSWGAYFEAEFGQSHMTGYRLLEAGRVVAELPSNTRVSQNAARELTPLLKEPEVLREAWAEVVELHPEPTAANVREVVQSRMDVHYSSKTDLWATPQDLFDKLASEFAFALDVCATPENAKCSSFYTEENDGLAQNWAGICWMNPPYGDAIGEWVKKAYESGQAGATVVCLVPARIDTAWWWNTCRHGEVRFLRGRLKFGDSANSAPFPSAVVVFGPDVTAKTVYWER